MNTINVQLENKLGILEKVTNVLTRNRIRLKNLAYELDNRQLTSLVSFSAEINKQEAEKLMKQMLRIVEVKSVKLN